MNQTEQLVKDLWAFLQKKYGTQVVNKATAPEMVLIADALHLMGIADKDVFLTQFTTTLGKTIYVPYEVGVESLEHPLLEQLITGVHEHQHVIQMLTNGTRFVTSYLLDTTWRAAYEAEAYRVSMTMFYHLTGMMLDPQDLAALLKAYGTTTADQEFVAEYLRLSLPTIQAGGVPDEASRVALDWLRQNSPETLKAL